MHLLLIWTYEEQLFKRRNHKETILGNKRKEKDLSSPNPDESGPALRTVLSLSNQNTADDREKTGLFSHKHYAAHQNTFHSMADPSWLSQDNGYSQVVKVNWIIVGSEWAPENPLCPFKEFGMKPSLSLIGLPRKGDTLSIINLT